MDTTNSNGKLGVLLKLAPLAVLFICLSVTWYIWSAVRQDAAKEVQLEFDAEVKEIHNRVGERLNDYRDLLRGVTGLFAASDVVTRQEFHTYVEQLDLPQSYPGIQGVGFAQLIPAREKQRLVRAIRREGFPQFEIRPTGTRDLYSAIIYLEPFDWRNQRAFGYDMYSEVVRRTAMERARDEGGPALSGKVVLVQETEKEVQSGFLLYLPVYRNGLPHETIAERRANLAGWVYEPFRMNDLMTKGVLGKFLDSVRNELDIEVYEGNSTDAHSLMYDSHVSEPNRNAQFSSVRQARYFGHDWTIVVHSLPAFEEKVMSGQTLLPAIVGVIISILLTLVVWLLSTTNARAIKLAEKMSAKLEQTLTHTIAAMAQVIEMRDPYTAGHQRRAAELARAIAEEMRLSSDEVRWLYRAALTYEIGKIQIPAEILSKPSALSEVEYSLVKMHAQAGSEIVRHIDFPGPVAEIVLQHHERLDGSGYPLGLKGDGILLGARILGVADVVEAMCSHRPYRPALGLDAALDEIFAKRGVLYDEAAVDACVRLFREQHYQLPD